MPSLDSFKSRKTLKVGAKTYTYYSLEAAAQNGLGDISRLPVSLKVLLENLLRFEDGSPSVAVNVVDWRYGTGIRLGLRAWLVRSTPATTD